MARLPQPGGDTGNWGTLLNDYLSIEHNADGTHNLPSGSIPYAVLSNPVQSSITRADTAMQPALFSAKGTIITASAPGTVAILAPGSNGQVLVADATLSTGLKWETLASGGSNPTGVAGGELSGTYPNPIIAAGVIGNTNISATAAIAKSKLAALNIADTDIAAGANIAQSKVAGLNTSLNTKADGTRNIATSGSLIGGGNLSADRTLSLSGDSATPGNSKYYGTNGSGSKGFFDLPSGGGAVSSVNSQTGAVSLDSDDITEAVSNLYFTNARADARIAAASIDDLNNVQLTSPSAGQVIKYNGTNWVNATDAVSGGAGGEANSAANIGTSGVGVFKQKLGTDIQLKKINSASSKITITDDTLNDEIDVDVNEANLNPANFSTNPLARANHTGTQDSNTITGTKTSSYISDFTTAADTRATTQIAAADVEDLNNVAITTPSSGQVLKYNGTNWVNGTDVSGGSAPVDSVNTQTGAVVLDADDLSDAATTNKFTTAAAITKLSGIEANAKDDQSAAEVVFTPNGDITGTTVQAAIEEVRNDADTKLAAKASTSHAHALSSTTDVVLTSPGTGEVLKYNGANWVNGTDLSGAGGSAMFIVAASNAPAVIKARADYTCSGSADEVEINTALLLGSVQLTDGDYSVNAPIRITRSGTTLMGTGRGATLTSGGHGGRGFGTLIKPSASFSSAADNEGVIIAELVAPATNKFIIGRVTIKDLEIDGELYAATAIHGIKLRGYQSTIQNIATLDMSGDGFHLIGNETPNVSWSTYDTTCHNLLSVRSAGAGFATKSNGTDLHITDLTTAYCYDGLRHSGGSAAQFTGCHFYGSTRNNIRLEEGSGTRDHFIGCKIQHAGEHGVYFIDNAGGSPVANAVEVQFTNCDFNCNGKLTTNTYNHVEMTFNRSANRPQFIGCTFGNSDNETNVAKYCINLSSTGIGAVISGCTFSKTLAGAGVATGFVRAVSTARDELVLTGCFGIADYIGVNAQPNSVITV